MRRTKRLWFWLWLFTGVALGASLAGWAPGLPLAVALAIAQVVHQAWRTRGLWTVPVQIRILFLVVLLLGATSPGMRALHVLQLGGIVVRVGFDYCVAGRLLALMPWNRRGPLTLSLVRATFRRRPDPATHLQP